MQIKGKYSWAKHIDFMMVDLGSLLLAFGIAFLLKFGNLDINEDWSKFATIISLFNIVISLMLTPYSGIFRRRYYQEISRAFILASSNALCIGLFLFVFKVGDTYSREVVIYTYLFYFIISLVLKYIWKQLLMKGVISITTTKKMSLFIICYADEAASVLHNAEASDLSVYEINGMYLLKRNNFDEPFVGEIYNGEMKNVNIIDENYRTYILENNIDEVLIAVNPGDLDSSVYEEMVSNGIGIDMVVESALGFQTEQQYITNIGVYKALSVGSFSFTPAQSFYLIVKRAVDIIGGIVGIVLLLPITLIVKIICLFSGDTGRIFYRQKRVGQNGKEIKIWKYRTMVKNADTMLEEMLKDEKWRVQWDANQKFEDDPRITRAGKLLRRTSIDELPQLINVFLGDMSLIGPRPLVEGELEAHNGLKIYQRVKPGITGWWACNGRSNIDYRERLELEYYYVKNCSLSLDILCIFRTILAVLKRDGAQ